MITPSFSLTATERVLPKLTLDFTTASLDARVTFTRTTNSTNPATYVNSSGVVTAATNNEPRFDYDPVSLICKGLLVEESRANNFLHSEDFSNGAWTPTSVGVSTNSTNSPAGTLTADTLYLNNGVASASGALYQQIAKAASALPYTFSVYAKADGSDVTTLRLYARPSTATGTADAYFNLSSGTITQAAAATGTFTSPSASMRAFGNGWYCCTLTFTTGTETLLRGYFFEYGNANSSITGNGSKGIYLWGAQLEAGAFATSYIPTTTAALTRNADVATMTGTNFSDWFNATEGSAVIQALPTTISGTRPAIQFDDTTSNELIAFRGVAADPQLYVVDGGAAQATLDAGTLTANSAYRLGGAWKSANFAVALNGGATVSQLSGTYPTVTQLRLGSDGTNYFNGWLQNLRYWVQRVTNSETQAFSK